MNSKTAFYLKGLAPLVGGVITGLASTGSDDEDEEFYGLMLRLPDGSDRILTFLSDDEGNGPGSFEITT